MELIKVTEENGEQLVSARELYDFLEATERFNSWFERQLQYGFQENVDFVGRKFFNTQANQELQDYILKIDMAKEISMLQRSEKGSQARRYFIECEKKSKNPISMLLSMSKEELAMTTLQLSNQIKETKEKLVQVEHTNSILMHVNKLYTSTEIAKELNLKSAAELNNKLKDLGVQYKQNDTWVLYSKYSNLGYVEIKQNVLDNGRVVYDRKWSQLGRKFLLELFSKEVV